MYEEYFHFSGQPFKLNPDPKFFFGSRSHNKAMAYLHYGLRQAEGFIVITGEIGAGKSMLIGHLLDQLDRSRIAAAHLLTPNLRPEDLLSHILSAFRIEPSGDSRTAELEAFEDFLFDQLNGGRRVLLIVDEAQNLPVDTLEELRVLSNLDYDGTPLFQVFLVGQPDFKPVLARSGMEQLRQRVIASYHLEPLSAPESREYVEHRLAIVGWSDDPAIDAGAHNAIFEATGGVPRKINKLCNRVLLHCSLEELHQIDAATVGRVNDDLMDETASVMSVADDAAPSEAASGADPETEPSDVAAVAISAGGRFEKETEMDRDSVIVPFQAVKRDVDETVDEKAGKAITASRESEDQHAPSAECVAPDEEGEMDHEDQDEDANASRADDAVNVDPTVQMSVLDRLKTKRKSTDKPKKATPSQDSDAAAAIAGAVDSREKPQSASISDVADAIAKASVTPIAAAADVVEPAKEIGALFDDETETTELDAPDLNEDAKGWRHSVVKSINETRDELKRAHSTMNSLRRQMNEVDKRRRQRKTKVVASLTRAENLLSEFRDTWK